VVPAARVGPWPIPVGEGDIDHGLGILNLRDVFLAGRIPDNGSRLVGAASRAHVRPGDHSCERSRGAPDVRLACVMVPPRAGVSAKAANAMRFRRRRAGAGLHR